MNDNVGVDVFAQVEADGQTARIGIGIGVGDLQDACGVGKILR